MLSDVLFIQHIFSKGNSFPKQNPVYANKPSSTRWGGRSIKDKFRHLSQFCIISMFYPPMVAGKGRMEPPFLPLAPPKAPLEPPKAPFPAGKGRTEPPSVPFSARKEPIEPRKEPLPAGKVRMAAAKFHGCLCSCSSVRFRWISGCTRTRHHQPCPGGTHAW